MVSQARSQCKTMLVNKALVLSVRRHHARVTHQIMLLVLSSAGARGAKGSNERRRERERHKFAYLVAKDNSFAPSARAFFIFVYFFAVVSKTTT